MPFGTRREGVPPARSSAAHGVAEPLGPALTRSRLLLYAAGAVLAIAFHLSGSGLVNLALVALFGLLFLFDPGIAPPLIAASLPFWQRTQPVLRWEFALFEVLAWIAVAAWMRARNAGLARGNTLRNSLVRALRSRPRTCSRPNPDRAFRRGPPGRPLCRGAGRGLARVPDRLSFGLVFYA